jgi:hypothetical protein
MSATNIGWLGTLAVSHISEVTTERHRFKHLAGGTHRLVNGALDIGATLHDGRFVETVLYDKDADHWYVTVVDRKTGGMFSAHAALQREASLIAVSQAVEAGSNV